MDLRDIPQVPLARAVPVVAADLFTTQDSWSRVATIARGTRGVVVQVDDLCGDVWVSFEGEEENLPVNPRDIRVDLHDPQGRGYVIGHFAHTMVESGYTETLRWWQYRAFSPEVRDDLFAWMRIIRDSEDAQGGT